MKMFARMGVVAGAIWLCGAMAMGAQENPLGSLSVPQHAADARDGAHDFDFEEGAWKIHLKRLENPLTASTKWVEFDGVSVTRKVWDGRADLEEFETVGGSQHIEGLTLRTYNPATHQWNLYWANSKEGTVDLPQVGAFQDGRGEFYCQDHLNGRAVLIRFVWSGITANSAHFEQAFSEDGGKTWEVNWITDQTRVKDLPEVPVEAKSEVSHDFDFNFGTWKTHIMRQRSPLTGKKDWVEMNGTVTVRKVWGGKAQLEEIEADGVDGHFEGATLFLYNPAVHQWSQTFVSSAEGELDTPSIGAFKDGRGNLYNTETVNGRTVLLRAEWTAITPNAHHFEESMSEDGGKTWEPAFVASLTRLK